MTTETKIDAKSYEIFLNNESESLSYQIRNHKERVKQLESLQDALDRMHPEEFTQYILKRKALDELRRNYQHAEIDAIGEIFKVVGLKLFSPLKEEGLDALKEFWKHPVWDIDITDYFKDEDEDDLVDDLLDD